MRPVLVLALAFLALPARAERPLRLAVLGDVHLGLAGPDKGLKMTASSERLFERAVDELNEMTVDLVVFDGDLVTDAEAYNYARFREIAGRLAAPWLVVLGNHDQPAVPPPGTDPKTFYPGLPRELVADLFRGHGFAGDGKTWWSTDVRGWHLVGLDADQATQVGGHVPPGELQWLEQDLSAHDNVPTLVFLHHNLADAFPEQHLRDLFLVDNRDAVKAILAKHHGVKAVFSAHYHFFWSGMESGIAYFTTPSIQTWPLRFAVFDLHDGGVEARAVRIGDDATTARAHDALAHDDFWRAMAREALKRANRPSDDASASALLYTLFGADAHVHYKLR